MILRWLASLEATEVAKRRYRETGDRSVSSRSDAAAWNHEVDP